MLFRRPFRRLRPTFFRALVAVLAGATATLLPAAELRLANGDRVTGEVVSRADGKIHFRSPILGLLVVDETAAAVLETPDEPVESLAGLPPKETSETSAPEASKPAAPSPTPSRPPGDSAVASTPETPRPPKTAAPVKKPAPAPVVPAAPRSLWARVVAGWKGKVELGYLQQSGRTERVDLSVRVEAEKKTPQNNYKVSARVLHGEQNDRRTSDRQEGSFRWRHDLTPRMFAQSLSSYYTDGIKQIDHNFEQNVGLGYKILSSSRHAINAGGGFTSQYRTSPTILPGWSYLIEAFEDYTFKMNSRFTFRQEASLFYSLNNPNLRTQATTANISTEEYRFKLNSSLQGALTDRVSINLRYEYEYDGTLTNRDLRGDQRITTSLGYAF